jgi:hypothetical protein
MQTSLLAPDFPPTRRVEATDVERHIERLTRMKALCGVLKSGRERHFNAVIARARSDARRADPEARTAALSALGLLALELCDA